MNNTKQFIREYIKNSLNDPNNHHSFLYGLFNHISLDDICILIKQYRINERKLAKVIYNIININQHFCLCLKPLKRLEPPCRV